MKIFKKPRNFNSFLNEFKVKILFHLKYTKYNLANDKMTINKQIFDYLKSMGLNGRYKTNRNVMKSLQETKRYFREQDEIYFIANEILAKVGRPKRFLYNNTIEELMIESKDYTFSFKFLKDRKESPSI
jgi:hypothetical protein